MVDVAVHGSRGYLGRTLVGLLADHRHVDEVVPVSTSEAGQVYGEVVPDLGHLSHLEIAGPGDRRVEEADVVLTATDAGTAESILASNHSGGDLVVDLSRAHRATALDGSGTWAYGLTELPGAIPEGTTHVANPGCYPTASLLSLGPALLAGLAGEGPLVVDGKSGVSGAGATPRPDLHFPETNESVRAYGVGGHDHQAEIQAAVANLEAAGPGQARPVRFTPHLVPQNRGLLTTAYLPLADGVDQAYVERMYEKAYPDGGFVEVVDEPDTAAVRGSNRAQVAATVDEDAGLLVARGAIDNLVKGGAGTAIQNMNRALGLDEQAGLPWMGVAP